MPIELPSEDDVPAGSLRDLVVAVHELYEAAGKPGVKSISSEIKKRDDVRDLVSHQTVNNILRGRGVPKWVKLESLVIHLALISVSRPEPRATALRIHSLWLAAERDALRKLGDQRRLDGPELSHALRELHAKAGRPGIHRVSEVSRTAFGGVPPSVISGWLQGRGVPRTFAALWQVVCALQRIRSWNPPAQESAELMDSEASWRRLWEEGKRDHEDLIEGEERPLGFVGSWLDRDDDTHSP